MQLLQNYIQKVKVQDFRNVKGIKIQLQAQPDWYGYGRSIYPKKH